MKTPYVDFKALKSAVGIRRVLERYQLLESLRELGERLSGSCPICEGESETSFRVSQEKNCFKCFSCEAGGNVLDFVAAMEDCSIRDAAVMIADWFGVETGRPARRKSPEGNRRREATPSRKAPAPQETAGEPYPTSETPPTSTPSLEPCKPLTFELKLDPDHPWFATAGLLPETVREFGLGFCSKGLMGGRIAFPLRDRDGQLIGYAGRWPGDDVPKDQPLWKYPKELDLSRIIYPADKLQGMDLRTALLAQDPLQVVLAWQLGLEGVVHFPAGGFTEATMRALHIAFG